MGFDKKELIKEFEEIGIYSLNVFGVKLKGIPTETAITLIEQLDEPKPVKVPQCVAEIIEYYKGQNATLYDALREKNFNKQYNEWLMNEQDAYNKVARAWLDGYEVEEEKQYAVKIKASGQYLAKTKLKEISFMYNGACSHFTRKELEEAGFGWVFNCEGIEIVEVE